MTLTTDQITQYRGYLKNAEEAYNSLMMTGAVRVFVDQNGERVEYTAVSASRLLAYIIRLKTMLGIDTAPDVVGPLNVWVI